LLRDLVAGVGKIVSAAASEEGNADDITATERLSECDRQLHDRVYDDTVYLRLG